MKILHFSDNHGKLIKIPKKYRNADTLIALTGDIAPTYVQNLIPCIKTKSGEMKECTWQDPWNYRKIDTIGEAACQKEWMEKTFIPDLLKQGISLEQIIILNGNHDFLDMENLFPYALTQGAKTIEWQGIKIGMMTGVLPIAGEWFDEIYENDFSERLKLISPGIDILITHAPLYGIKDHCYGVDHIGSQSIYTACFGRSIFDAQPPYFNRLRFHLFGHAHTYPNPGVSKYEIAGRLVRFCNAAEIKLEIDYT